MKSCTISFRRILVLVSVVFNATANTSLAQANIAHTVNVGSIQTVPSVVSFTPLLNALNVAPNSAVSVSFDVSVKGSTVTNSTVSIKGSVSGKHQCVFSFTAESTTVQMEPNKPFGIGEIVTVTLTRGIASMTGDSLSRSYSWSFTIRTNPQSGLFRQVSSANVGNNPFIAAAADIDGDGYVDLISVNNYSNDISILKNRGDGTYALSSTLSVGYYPSDVVAADFNNDGSIDLAVATGRGNSVAIYVNNGTGTFTQGQTINVSSMSWGLVAVDVDGDGAMDLAVGLPDLNAVTILKNNGSGVFTQTSTITVGSSPRYILSADLDGDGFMDLAVLNFDSNTVSILKNSGTGQFTQTSTVAVGSYPWFMTAADFNNDGAIDLAVANSGSNTISVLMNNGSGTFSVGSTLNGGISPVGIAAIDIDGDGKTDLVIGSATVGVITIQKNIGGGGWSAGTPLAVGGVARAILGIDADNDGSIELAVTDNRTNAMDIFKNRPRGASLCLVPNSIDFGSVSTGKTRSQYLKIDNEGTDSSLVISSITSSLEAFTVNRASLTIPPSCYDSILVTFHPTSKGSIYSDSLIFVSNDAKKPVTEIYLTGSSSFSQPNVVFTLNVGGPIYAGISVLGDNAMYAIASGDAVYRLNVGGSIIYTLQVAGNIRSSSSIAFDTTIFIASSDRNLYSFSKDGNSIWPPLPTGGVLTATPTIDSATNRLYIGVSNNNFIAVNRSTGAVAWNYFADAQIRNSAVVTRDRKLIFATQKGTLYGFDLDNLTLPATPNWKISLPDTAPSSIAVDNQGSIYVGTNSGLLLKILMRADNQPSIVWQVPLGHAITGSPVIDAGGTLYVGSLDANLYAIDIQSGVVRWAFSTKGAIRGTPAISDAGIIYVANDSGEVISLDTTKNVFWYYKTTGAIVAPLLYYKSTLYVGTLGNQIIALFDGADSLHMNSLSKTVAIDQYNAKPIWGTFQGNNQRTGLFYGSGTTGVKNPVGVIPTDFALLQNYPNPFNPSTTLRYGLPARSLVHLRIYNILGQVVADLVNTEQSAGWNQVAWNANGSSGLYFYRLEAISVSNPRKRFVDAKKMILLK